jgi:beta-galactosidase
VDANRKPRPGLLDFKKVIEPLNISVSADWSTFIVRNKFDFADTSDLRFGYSVESDGGTLDGGRVDVASVAPGAEAAVRLPAGVAALAGDRTAVLTVRAELDVDTEWAEAGHEIAWGQASVNLPAAPLVHATESVVAHGAVAEADAESDDAELRLGPAVFSRVTGLPTRLGGVPVVDLRLVLWRAPTDNDYGVDWWGNPDAPTLAQRWVEAGLNRLHARLIGITAVADADGGEALVVRTRVGIADKQYGVFVDYTWTSDGDTVSLRTQVRPDGDWINKGQDVPWARIGLELVLDSRAQTVDWFGQGPHQAYPDTGQGARQGWYSLPMADMVVDYARPQESGARAAVHRATLQLDGGRLAVSGEPFALSVRPYSLDVLDAAGHQPDLLEDGRAYVYLDCAQRGVGTGACGPGVLEPYRITGREADFTLVFEAAD